MRDFFSNKNFSLFKTLLFSEIWTTVLFSTLIILFCIVLKSLPEHAFQIKVENLKQDSRI